MKKAKFTFLITAVLTFGIILGFSISDEKPLSKSLNGSRKSNNEVKSVKGLNNIPHDNKSIQSETDGVPYYTDNFDGANDTTSLKARGYKVYYRGGGAQVGPTWFQGNSAVFAAFNGPTSGYVGSNFEVVSGTNNIDNWLVLPKKNVAAIDSLFFYQRSEFDPTYPDSIRVMYSAVGDSTPEAGSWVELGRLRANFATNAWVRVGFKAASAGANARFAIRYNVVNGGPSGANSDFIGIDALTIESPPISADVGSQSINVPAGNITLPSPAITPSATVKNFGTTLQSFNVTMTISPGGYSSTQSVTSLGAGATQNVNFSSYTPTGGNFTATVFTQLASDGNKANDTLRKSFGVYNPNFGGASPFNNSSYFYANSTAGSSGAPSQPGYCWSDTTGSTTLANNSTLVAPQSNGIISSLDDGHWTLYQPGGSTRKVKFDGVVYDSVFVGTNGIICFTNFVPGGGNWDPPASGLPGNGAGGKSRPGIYPLWNDLNWGNLSQPVNRLSWKVDASKNQLIITYDRAPLFGGTATDFVTFQTVIGLQADTAGAPNSNITFQYSNTSTNFNLPALTGIQNSTGSAWAQYFYMNASAVLVTAGPMIIVDSTITGGGLAVAYGPSASNLTGNCKELRLRALVEGYWNGTNIPDTMRVEVRSSVSPYNIIDLQFAVSDAAGIYSVDVSNVNNGVSYYLVTRNRNSIETWSKLPQTWTSSLLVYDFTTAATQAFGNNQTFKNTKWTIYSGDVNQDGIVDGGDGALVDNDASNFVSGYVQSDVNGDQIVDGSDAAIVDNNASNFVSVARP